MISLLQLYQESFKETTASKSALKDNYQCKLTILLHYRYVAITKTYN